MFKKKNQADDAAAATSAAAPAVAPKEPLTEEQKKLRLQLGFIGVLAVIAAAIYLPGLFGGKKKPTPAPAPAPVEQTAPNPGAPGAPLPGEAPPPAPAPPSPGQVNATKAIAPVSRYRQDPFTQFYTGVILPDPTPTPVPPVILPPVELPTAPFQPGVSIATSGGGGSSSQALVGLPRPRITRLSSRPTAPQVVTPPRRQAGGPVGGGSDGLNPSYNKRLSGFIIGDGVRALLEINKGNEIVTRVVQPGDEVDGITILNIQRVTEGTRTITRMTIRENGEERYVDLKAGVQITNPEGGNPGGI